MCERFLDTSEKNKTKINKKGGVITDKEIEEAVELIKKITDRNDQVLSHNEQAFMEDEINCPSPRDLRF